MSKFLREIQSNEVAKFIGAGIGRTAVLVNDITNATNILSISAEALAFTAGAAGTTGTVALDNAPIFDSLGTEIGHVDDTSFAFVTGTVLTTEVKYDQTLGDTAFLATLNQGEYAIDYPSGKLFYCKATTGTADTANYTTRQANVEVTFGGSVTIGAVDINSGAAQALGQDVAGADAYATVLTPSADAKHAYIKLEGSNNAIISFDGGTTDQFEIAANSVVSIDWITITSGVAIQAKNASAGNNYANLAITIW